EADFCLFTMATETLNTDIRRLTVMIFILIKCNSLSCQQFIISFQTVSDCVVGHFYDVSSLSCVQCGEDQRASATGLACVCLPGHRVHKSNGASLTCQRCPPEKPVCKDGFGCIRCPGGLSEEGTCLCPQGTVRVERDLQGNPLDEARCEACNGDGPAFSVPNNNGDSCERCQASFVNTSNSCCRHSLCVPPLSVCVSLLMCSCITQSIVCVCGGCIQVFTNLTACQALGNMCVMNMHSFSSVTNDACGLFNLIFRSMAALGTTQDISYWRTNLPWLYYGDQPGLAGRVLQTDPLPIEFSFKGSKKFYCIHPSVQLCPDTALRQRAAYTFGTAYQESCDMSVSELLRTYPEPLFYDVFVDLSQGEARKLLAVPSLVLNQQYNGRYVNQENVKNWYLSRRVFVVDTLSGREKSLSSKPKAIRVAADIKLRFQLVPGTQKGQAFPPLLSVSYKDVFLTDLATQKYIHFTINEGSIALGVMGGMAVLYSLLKTVSWKRRISSPLVDMETLLKFLLFYAGDLANVFFCITVGTGLYWLIFSKAQQFVSVLLPLPAQEERMVTYIGCAFALKAIQFLHKLILQLSVDIFLIDWERPRSKAASGEAKRDPSPVSIWRTYFVANEWNEIQTIRKISPTFQVIAVLFFLEVLGFSNLALRDPWSTLERPPQAYKPPYSLTLRYALASTLWLCIGLLQVVFFTVFHERFVEDKIRQFVDLCSISNVSMLVLSHQCFGYYIHGRSVHGHADTNMEEMNTNLKREAESLCGQRGLLPNTDTQTFQVSISTRLRQQYDRIREPLGRRNGPSRLVDASSANPFEQSTRAYNTMNRFLGSVIDHAHRDMDYIVKDKLFLERVIGMELLEPNEKSIFYNDESHSFSDVLFYGNEATLLIFDTLFFCVVDLGSQSFVLAAVLTYVQQMIFRWIRGVLGRRNLANKTLVDERFLI
uniref:Transmembrane protein 67 n=1 Tax=Gadus morhua TaxID=8049 RepID=A0A8C5BUE8_GADMO